MQTAPRSQQSHPRHRRPRGPASRRWGIILSGVALSSTLGLMGCGGTVKDVVAPNGTAGFSIECRKSRSTCLVRASELCPSGYSLLGADRSSDRTITPDMLTDGHLYISCRDSNWAANGKSRHGALDRDPPRTTSVEPPAGAVGVRFGASTEKVQALCEGAGHSWSMNGDLGVCDGTLKEMAFSATLSVRFCEGEACGVELNVPLDTKWAATVGTFRQSVVERYGKPTQATLDVPGRCRDQECKTSRVEFAWAWADGHLIRMRLSDNRRELSILYAAPTLEQATASNGL